MSKAADLDCDWRDSNGMEYKIHLKIIPVQCINCISILGISTISYRPPSHSILKALLKVKVAQMAPNDDKFPCS